MARGGRRANSGRKRIISNKTRVNWSINKELVETLRKKSKDECVSMSSIVEKSLTEYFIEESKSLPEMLIVDRITKGL